MKEQMKAKSRRGKQKNHFWIPRSLKNRKGTKKFNRNDIITVEKTCK